MRHSRPAAVLRAVVQLADARVVKLDTTVPTELSKVAAALSVVSSAGDIFGHISLFFFLMILIFYSLLISLVK